MIKVEEFIRIDIVEYQSQSLFLTHPLVDSGVGSSLMNERDDAMQWKILGKR